jgi:hypothetical protein
MEANMLKVQNIFKSIYDWISEDIRGVMNAA